MNHYQTTALNLINKHILKLETQLTSLKTTKQRIQKEGKQKEREK